MITKETNYLILVDDSPHLDFFLQLLVCQISKYQTPPEYMQLFFIDQVDNFLSYVLLMQILGIYQSKDSFVFLIDGHLGNYLEKTHDGEIVIQLIKQILPNNLFISISVSGKVPGSDFHLGKNLQNFRGLVDQILSYLI